jgi:uncharacterized protein GlcG (DUF336 family)
MSFILISRNRTTNRLIAIVEDDGKIAEFETREDAEESARETTVCKAWGHQVVEID